VAVALVIGVADLVARRRDAAREPVTTTARGAE
jgi:hypothetical protein